MKDRSVDLSVFTQKLEDERVAKSENSWNEQYGFRERFYYCYEFTPEEIEEILKGSNVEQQRRLSRAFFEKNGFYKKLILHYATILDYIGILIPNSINGKKLSTSFVQKPYHKALHYLERLHLKELFTRLSTRALIDGCYYGAIQTLEKDEFILIDLPSDYARSRFRDVYGNDLVEFNVAYFDSITDETARKEALDSYPKIISSYYSKWKRGKVEYSWVRLPSEIGVYFSFYDSGRPLFLDIIPSILAYDSTVEVEQEKQLDDIRKIIVQHVPHLNDGQLVFEPDEAAVMHEGAVKMLRGQKNISVLTSYADVDAIVSKTTSENSGTIIEKMLSTIYSQAGVSPQLFASSGGQALPYSIKNDILLMMILGDKYARFLGFLVNTLFSNANIYFTYKMLPVGLYNQGEYIKDSLKMAQSGYSFLVAGAATGLNQYELTSVKQLENDILDLRNLLIPLSSSYTQSGSGEVGAPAKSLEDKSDKTIQNEKSLENQGGSV